MDEWAEAVYAILVTALFVVFFGAFVVVSEDNIKLKAQLADPHHCVSVCVEEFEKYGC